MFVCMYGYGFLAGDRCEILRVGSAYLRQVFSYFGDNPRDGQIFGVDRAGYASGWSTSRSTLCLKKVPTFKLSNFVTS